MGTISIPTEGASNDIAFKSVTNRVKLTDKYIGVTGYLCVTAGKGAATTKNC